MSFSLFLKPLHLFSVCLCDKIPFLKHYCLKRWNFILCEIQIAHSFQKYILIKLIEYFSSSPVPYTFKNVSIFQNCTYDFRMVSSRLILSNTNLLFVVHLLIKTEYEDVFDNFICYLTSKAHAAKCIVKRCIVCINRCNLFCNYFVKLTACLWWWEIFRKKNIFLWSLWAIK